MPRFNSYSSIELFVRLRGLLHMAKCPALVELRAVHVRDALTIRAELRERGHYKGY